MTIGDHTVLDDRYALDDLIGQGGMADVYRGTDRVLLRSVAVKVLREIADPVQRDRFVHEARTLAALNHPGLVTLLDAGITADHPYLVMELAEGCSLSGRIAQGPLPPDEVARIGRQLAEALAYAHEQGVVHRDVKPSNVLLVEDRALLVDFGIARLIGETEHHTRTGDAIGSPAYLAPEQVAGEELTPAADIFSLGLVLLEALTGRRAYTGAPVEAAMARLNTAPAIPTSLGPAWRALIARMTHREPANRPDASEVAAVAAELGTTSGAGPLSASGPAGSSAPATADPLAETGELAVTMEAPLVPLGAVLEPEPTAGPARRRRRGRYAVLALLAVLVVAAGIALYVAQQRDDHPADQPEVTVPSSVPTGVPDRLRGPLVDLHRVVQEAGR